MNLETLALSGAVALSTTVHRVGAIAASAGRTTFRRVFGLRIRTGGIADAIRFQPDAAHLDVEFRPLEYDARSQQPLATIQSKGSQRLVVELPTPMQLRRIEFSSVGTSVEIFRMDGDEVAKEPTKTPANDATVSGDFTDRRFALRFLNGGSPTGITSASLDKLLVKGFPTGPRLGIANAGQPDTATFFWTVAGEVGRPNGPSGSADAGRALAEAIQRHIDTLGPPYPDTIHLLLVAESDAPCELDVNSFSVPFGLVRTSFRALLLRTEDVTDASAFATRLRDGSTPLTQYLRARLTDGTRNSIDRLNGRSVPERVVASLVRDLNAALQAQAFYTAQRFQGIALTPETLAAAQSTPVGVARTRVNRSLLEEAFPSEIASLPEADPDEKEVLRVEGATAELDAGVDLPRTATIRSATLRLEADLRADVAGSASEQGVVNTSWDAAIAGALGIEVDGSRAVARRITPPAALDLSGLLLALTSTSQDAELVAEIREDQNGVPAGRIVATGPCNITQLDRPAWMHFAFGSPAVLPAQPHWIVLRATNGSVIWLAEAAAAAARVGDATARGWTDRGSFEDVALLHQLWSPSAGTTSTDEDDISARLRVIIGGSVIAPTPAVLGRARVVDIASALQSWLAAQAGPAGIISAPIRVRALGKGRVTVYPPEIVYDLYLFS